MKLVRVVLAMMVALAAWLALPSQARADNHVAMVSVLHGVPGATVDVWANGKPLLTNFAPGTLTDPVALPAGSYDLKVVKAGDPATATAVIEAKGVKVPGGANITVVAHLDADGKPVLTPFVNDTSMSAKGSRVVVRHVAAAPAVDVRANGDVLFGNLVNPKQVMADVEPMSVTADVVLAGTATVAIGPAELNLADGQSTIVYAWGSAADQNLKLAVQTVELKNPGTMPQTGVADAGTSPLTSGLALALLAGVGIAAFGASRLVRASN